VPFSTLCIVEGQSVQNAISQYKNPCKNVIAYHGNIGLGYSQIESRTCLKMLPETASTAHKVGVILDFLHEPLDSWKSTCIDNTAADSNQNKKPFCLAISGVQGCGKSTLIGDLSSALIKEGYRVVSLSLDDLYLTAEDLKLAAASHPTNKLLSSRGEPGTHDILLANNLFTQLRDNEIASCRIPSYDKSAHNGKGDRRPEETWARVSKPIDILIFEGWCVGFRPVQDSVVMEKVMRAQIQDQKYLLEHKLEDLLFVNKKLQEYSQGFMDSQSFDVLIHLDTNDLQNIFQWREEQEIYLRKATGRGMSHEEVEIFGKTQSVQSLVEGCSLTAV
jgi:D-glycerate 3-kinase